MKIGSLFTGCGGLDLAVEDVFDAEPVWTADADPSKAERFHTPSKIIAARFPDAPNLGDVTKIKWEDQQPVDIITAGWPCQPFSHAGQRKGIEDDRALWPEVVRAVCALRPRYVVMENVAAIATARTGPELARATAQLAGVGYVGQWLRLHASDVGAPHRRARIFLLAADSTGIGPQRPRTPRRRRTRSSDSGGATADADRYGFKIIAERDSRRLESIKTSQRTNTHRRVRRSTFGGFAEAVKRWEMILDRPAPRPSVDDRLNPWFVEWMQGLPKGWVCGVPDVSGPQQLRVLGNSVVPQQASAAIRIMINNWRLS